MFIKAGVGGKHCQGSECLLICLNAPVVIAGSIKFKVRPAGINTDMVYCAFWPLLQKGKIIQTCNFISHRIFLVECLPDVTRTDPLSQTNKDGKMARISFDMPGSCDIITMYATSCLMPSDGL